MAIRSKNYIADYERRGEPLVAVCTACHRSSVLSFREIRRRAWHMKTLEELAKKLRCRNCKRKVAEVKLQRWYTRPPPSQRH